MRSTVQRPPPLAPSLCHICAKWRETEERGGKQAEGEGEGGNVRVVQARQIFPVREHARMGNGRTRTGHWTAQTPDRCECSFLFERRFPIPSVNDVVVRRQLRLT